MQTDGWQRCAPPWPWRASQQQALDAVARAGRNSADVVLPPGAGKTAVGLEVARSLARPTLVLTPNTAVQGQWLRTWRDFAPPAPPGARRVHPQPASSSRELTTALTVLTHAQLSDWGSSPGDEDEPDDVSAALAEQRRAAVRGAPDADVLSLLHARGRDVVARAAPLGPWTLVLDGSHALLASWGPLVPALAAALGADTFVLGLSAAGPEALAARHRPTYDALFGEASLEVAVPAAVRAGELAPSQSLLRTCTPLPGEQETVHAAAERFDRLRHQLLSERRGSLPLPDWLRRRLHDEEPWAEIEIDEPSFARAALRLCVARSLPLPAGARLSAPHRAPLDAQDWAAVIGGYARDQLVGSTDDSDAALLASVREALPGLGWLLTGRGLRATTSPVERLCARSPAKAGAAAEVLEAESAALGERLRALVVCDDDSAAPPPQSPTTASPTATSRLVGAETPTGLAHEAFWALATGSLAPVLRPVLCTGRTLVMRRDDLVSLRAFAPPSLADRLVAVAYGPDRSLVGITAGADWTARTWVPLVTDWLAAGGTQLIVGTRGLLGTGWDCPSLNVVVDLTSANDAFSAVDVPGRGLHRNLDHPDLDHPDLDHRDEVVDLWTVVCMTDAHPAGGADFARAVRRHEQRFTPTPDGLLEAGIRACDPALSPFHAPDAATRAQVDARALQRTGERTAAHDTWREGSGEGAAAPVLAVRTDRGLGLPGSAVPASAVRVTGALGPTEHVPLPEPPERWRWWAVPAAGLVVALVLAVVVAVVAGLWPAVVAFVVVLAAVLAWVATTRYGKEMNATDDGGRAALQRLAEVVADAVPGRTGRIQVDSDPDGSFRVALDDEPAAAEVFRDALEELLLPPASPRWLAPRLVVCLDGDRRDRARALGRRPEGAVCWHAVPQALSGEAELPAFREAWRRLVGPFALVDVAEPGGAALLAQLQGADPFGVTTRRRTVWRTDRSH